MNNSSKSSANGKQAKIKDITRTGKSPGIFLEVGINYMLV